MTWSWIRFLILSPLLLEGWAVPTALQNLDPNCDIMAALNGTSQCARLFAPEPMNIRSPTEAFKSICSKLVSRETDVSDCFSRNIPSLTCPNYLEMQLQSLDIQVDMCRGIAKCPNTTRAVNVLLNCTMEAARHIQTSRSSSFCNIGVTLYKKMKECITRKANACEALGTAIDQSIQQMTSLCSSDAPAAPCQNMEQKAGALLSCKEKFPIRSSDKRSDQCNNLQQLWRCASRWIADCPYLQDQLMQQTRVMSDICQLDPRDPEAVPATMSPQSRCIDQTMEASKCMQHLMSSALTPKATSGGGLEIDFASICRSIAPYKTQVTGCVREAADKCPDPEYKTQINGMVALFQFCDKGLKCDRFNEVSENMKKCTNDMMDKIRQQKLPQDQAFTCRVTQEMITCMLEGSKACPDVAEMLRSQLNNPAYIKPLKQMCPNLTLSRRVEEESAGDPCAVSAMTGTAQGATCIETFYNKAPGLQDTVAICGAYTIMTSCIREAAGGCTKLDESLLRMRPRGTDPGYQTLCQGCPDIDQRALKMQACYSITRLQDDMLKLKNNKDDQQLCTDMRKMAECAAEVSRDCLLLAKRGEEEFTNLNNQIKTFCPLKLAFHKKETGAGRVWTSDVLVLFFACLTTLCFRLNM